MQNNMEERHEQEVIRSELLRALDAPPEFLEGLLDEYGKREYVAKAHFPLPEKPACRVRVRGTLLTLAAAKNRVEHAALLLAQGFDVNGDTPDAVQEHLRVANYDPDELHYGFGGVHESFLYMITDLYLQKRREIWHLTPLAAAVACGSVETAELLLGCPGVRLAESSAVCRAAMLALGGAPRQRQCAGMAFRLAGPERTWTEELLQRYLPDPAAIADLCTAPQLALLLDKGRFSEEQLRETARRLPALGPERIALAGFWPESAGKERAAGEERDISDLPVACFTGEASEGRKHPVRGILRRLGDGRSLCAASESPWLYAAAHRDPDALRMLVDRVRFYRRADRGISGLAMALLEAGDPVCLKRAAERGVFRDEPREELVSFVRKKHLKTTSRAFVLSLPPEAPRTGERRLWGQCWTSRWEDAPVGEYYDWLARAWEEPLSYDECLDRVETMAYDAGRTVELLRNQAWGNPLGFDPPRKTALPFSDKGEYRDLYAAGMHGGNPELLRAALDLAPPPRAVFWRVSSERGILEGSLLCAAAYLGRKKEAELLLEKGASADEESVRSRYTSPDGERRAVMPSDAAELGGHAELAALLRRSAP